MSVRPLSQPTFDCDVFAKVLLNVAEQKLVRRRELLVQLTVRPAFADYEPGHRTCTGLTEQANSAYGSWRRHLEGADELLVINAARDNRTSAAVTERADKYPREGRK